VRGILRQHLRWHHEVRRDRERRGWVRLAEVGLRVPLVVRLAGTQCGTRNQDPGRIRAWPITSASDMADGARKVVALGERAGGLTMAILADNKTRVVVQGLEPARPGPSTPSRCANYGTKGGGRGDPGQGRHCARGFPVFDTVAQAVAKTAPTPA